jgi:hypothetical protein
VALVNGEPLCGELLELFAAKHRALVPAGQWKAAALAAAIDWKVRQLWAKDRGLVQDASFSTLEQELREVNRARKHALAAGQPVYGPVEYDAGTYLDILAGTWQTAMLERFYYKAEYAPGRIREYYEANKEAAFTLPATVRVNAMFLPYREGQRGQEIVRLLEEAGGRLAEGERWQSVAQTYQGMEALRGLIAEERVFGEREYRENRLRPALLREIERLAAGAVSGVFEDMDGYYLLQGLSRTAGGLVSYEEAKGKIYAVLAEEDYRRDWELKRKAASVVVDEQALSRLVLP